jgi:isopenicillin N synthase-like dioxygenase
MIVYTPAKPADSIPVIDIADSYSPDIAKRRAVAWDIHKACRDTGFFYISGHGVPDDLIADQLEFARRFFDLPQAAKDRVHLRNSDCMRGYEPMMTQTLDAGSPADLKESFMLGDDPKPDHPFVLKKVPRFGPNQWPDDLPGFREQMTTYSNHIVRLGRHLMACLALSLDLPEDFFTAGVETPMYSVRLLHYPPQPETSAFNQLGAGAHTDWGGITLLLQDAVGGLEVQNAQGEWIRATPVPGTFVVNLGDMIQRWTNDLYHSNSHRVLNNVSGRERYSVATFFNPEYFYRVECLPTCRPTDGPPKYAPCTVGEHIDEMFRLTYAAA